LLKDCGLLLIQRPGCWFLLPSGEVFVELTKTSTTLADWANVGAAVLPALNASGDLSRLSNALEWFFDIDLGTYRLFVLDTRTYRGFDGARPLPALFSCRTARASARRCGSNMKTASAWSLPRDAPARRALPQARAARGEGGVSGR
jgi:hypothetical protein